MWVYHLLVVLAVIGPQSFWRWLTHIMTEHTHTYTHARTHTHTRTHTHIHTHVCTMCVCHTRVPSTWRYTPHVPMITMVTIGKQVHIPCTKSMYREEKGGSHNPCEVAHICLCRTQVVRLTSTRRPSPTPTACLACTHKANSSSSSSSPTATPCARQARQIPWRRTMIRWVCHATMCVAIRISPITVAYNCGLSRWHTCSK